MNKDELLKEIMKLPKAETINPISTMNSINIDDLMSAVDRLNKVPNYNDLLKENKKYKEVIDKVNNKLSQYKNDLKEYQEQDRINHQNISIGLVGVKIRAFEDILKEVE